MLTQRTVRKCIPSLAVEPEYSRIRTLSTLRVSA